MNQNYIIDKDIKANLTIVIYQTVNFFIDRGTVLINLLAKS